MSKTDQRFTQDYWLKTLPIATVQPLVFKTNFRKDESITSWLIRASFSQFCPPLSFTWYHWRPLRIWVYDVDKGFEHIDAQIQKDIASLAEIDDKDVSQHTLAYFAKCIGANINSKVAYPWTTPLSKRNRYSRIGNHYCPECLENDDEAYLSILWRFSWVVCCTKHKIALQSNCPHCDAPYQPQLIPIDIGKINYCYSCSEKMNALTAKLIPSEAVCEYQATAISVYRAKQGIVFNQMVDIADWFESLLFLINMTKKAVNNIDHKFGKILLSLGVLHAIDEITVPRSRLSFDHLSVKERLFLLESAYRLMQIPLEQWMLVCEQHDATQNSFHWSKDTVIPKPFLPVYNQLPKSNKAKKKVDSNLNNPTPPNVVINHWARLKRKMEMQKAYEKHRESNQEKQM